MLTRPTYARQFGAGGDITDPLSAEREHAELAAIVESSDDAIISKTLDGVIVSWNVGAEKIYGYAASEIIGRSITILAPPDRRDEISKILARIKRGESIEHFQTKRLCKDGTEISVSLTISPIKSRKGEIIGASTIGRDVSAQKEAERELRESEQRFRELAENIHEVFWLSDSKNTRMNYISPAYEKVWGRSCESLYAAPTSWMEAVHPDDKKQVLASVATRTPNEPYHNTYRIVRPDGSIRWIRDRGFPVRDESGTVVRFAGIAEDITESKLAADVVRESEAKFRQLLGSNIVGVVFWNLRGEILDANDLFLNTVGYTREDLRQGNLSWKNLTPPEYAALDEKAIGQLKAAGTCDPFEKEYIHKDGSRVSVLIGSALLDGQHESGSSFIMDITKRKKVEEALHKANRLLRVLSRRHVRVQEEERRHLARELHDQIGQALTATKISVQSAKRSRKRDTTVGHLDKAAAVLDQLLAQVRQITLDLRPAALDDLGLGPALRLVLHDYARRAGWHIHFVGDPNLERPDPEVETACFRIALEALTNIVRHARAQKVWLELHNAADSLHLIVRDDGVGFDSVDAEKRVERDRLGLVGMRERAIAVGGTFECSSGLGRGTEVHAFLPFHPG